ncbi:unnamed protein product [Symbiodinium sp. CCMP2592]|nr:unnamed protein product [Symbiodinium sp. CCMP2592]
MGKRSGSAADPASKKKGRAAAKAAPAPVLPAGPAPVTSSSNAECLQAHTDHVQYFHAHAVSGKAELLKPPQQCFVQPFDPAAALISLKRDKRYLCAINLAWLNPGYAPLPQMPLNRGAIRTIRDHWFSRPASFASQKLAVPILRAEIDADSLPAFGLWRTLSPIESVMAWYEAAWQSAVKVEENGGNDPENVLDEWLEHLVTAPAALVVVESEQDLSWQAQQWKEDATTLTVLGCTAIQRVFDIHHRRLLLGDQWSAERIVEDYNKNLVLSPKSEPIKVGMVSHCTTIYDRLLGHPRVVDLMLQEDGENLGESKGIFGLTSQLHALASKVGGLTTDEVVWVVSILIDQRKAGFLDPASATSRFLTGTASERNKGYVDVVIYKMKLRLHLLGPWLDSNVEAAQHRDILKQTFHEPGEFRKKFGYPRESEVDLSWKAGWPASADLLIPLLQDIIYTSKYDGDLKVAVRNQTEVVDVVNGSGTIGEELKKVSEQFTKEKKAKDLAQAAAQTDSGSAPAAAAEAASDTSRSPAVQSFMVGRVCSDEAKLAEAEQKAKFLINSNVQFMVYPGSYVDLEKKMKASSASKPCERPKWTLIFVDPAQLGEAATAPHLRTVPLNSKFISNFLKAVVHTRDNTGSMLGGRDLYVLCSNGSTTNVTKLPNLLQEKGRDPTSAIASAYVLDDAGDSLAQNVCRLCVSYEEEAIRSRRRSTNAGVDQIETLVLVTAEPFSQSMDQRPRLSNPKATNVGNMVALHMDNPSNLWMLPHQEKVSMLGPFRVAVGGKTTGFDATTTPRQSKTAMEAVFHHERSKPFFEELIHSYNVGAILDCSASSGTLAFVATCRRIPYFGVCLTADHESLLKNRLCAMLMEEFLKANGDLYDGKLAACVGPSTGGNGNQQAGTSNTGGNGNQQPGTSGMDEMQAGRI